MEIFLGLVCSGASLVLMAAVGWMNYRFMSRLGVSEIDGQVLGAASIAVDVLLGLLGPLLLWGRANGRRVYVWSGIAVVLCFAVLSFVSALGFTAEGRDGAVARRETERLLIEAARRRLDALEEARKLAGKTGRPVVVEAELAALRADRRWAASKECTVPQGQAVGWCRILRQLEVKWAAAKEADRLDGEIKAAWSDLVALREKAGRGVLDAQVAFLGEITGWPEVKLQVALALLAAFVMELGAGFGVTLGLAPLQARLRERREQRLAMPWWGDHLVWGPGAPPHDGGVSEKTMAGSPAGEPATPPPGVPREGKPRPNGEGRRRRAHGVSESR